MSRPTVAAVFVVHQEALRLRAALEDIRPHVDEIVVCVQESTDTTLAIARELADTVIEHPHYGHAAPSRGHAYDAPNSDWVLALDADEQLSDSGKSLLRSLIATEDIDLWWLRELTTVDAQIIEDAPHARLFRKGCVLPPTRVHQEVSARSGRVGKIADRVMIIHSKSHAEQAADDARYRKLMGDTAYEAVVKGRHIL